MYACVSSCRTHPTSSGCSLNQRSLSVIVSPPVTPGGPAGSTSIVTGGRGGSTPISLATADPCSLTSRSAHVRIRSRSRRPIGLHASAVETPPYERSFARELLRYIALLQTIAPDGGSEGGDPDGAQEGTRWAPVG